MNSRIPWAGLAVFLATVFTFAAAYDGLEAEQADLQDQVTVIAEQTQVDLEPEPESEPAPAAEPAPDPEPEREPVAIAEPVIPPAGPDSDIPSTSDYRPDIPLLPEEQHALLCACREFNISPSLVLGVIQHETNFTNSRGDHGRSLGYMQIQPRWWTRLMDEIGATDLMIPEDNFRTGCAILRQLIDDAEGNISVALTVYNVGHDDGTRTYAMEVQRLAALWE